MEATITCNSCGEPAVEYDFDCIAPVTLEGKISHCLSCSALGRVSVDDENGRIQFIVLTAEEISHVDFATLVDAYEASQKIIDELYSEVSSLRMKLAQQGVLA